ncbi:MAG: DUF4382 domain-containing protein [bacterium]
MKLIKLGTKLLSLIFPILFLTHCGGGGGETGQVKMSLTDAASDQYKAVYVTIDSVEIHPAGGADDAWQTVGSPHKTFNLLDLANGVREELGIATLGAGHYTQVRLLLGATPDNGINLLSKSHPFANYVIDTTDTVHELKVPSGFQTGIKIVHEFDVNANDTTELILDFNATASVVIAGNSGKYLLKPTIKILELVDFTVLSGTVTNAGDNSLIGGALVSAQVYDPAAPDAKDQVTVETATVTNPDGTYKLFVKPGTYNIVAVKSGFNPAAQKVTLVSGTTPTQNLSLSATTTGTVTEQATIAGADNETFVTTSFRQASPTSTDLIEVLSVNVANGAGGTFTLNSGNFNAVSSTFGTSTQTAPVTVTGGADTPLAVHF